MTRLVLGLIPVALLVALAATWAARTLGHRLQALDGAGVAGQVKDAPRRVPNIGGIGIVLGFALPVALGLLFLGGATVPLQEWSFIPADLEEHLAGLTSKLGDAWILLGCVLALHALGLIDDRRPMGPWIKLAIMLGVASAAVVATDTRLLTLLDSRVGGPWLSMLITVLWIGVVINAINFLDNMDGLAAGVGLMACVSFLTIALLTGQWFIGACFALLAGSLLGFLWFNKPKASIFMGDGGSLVLGFLLAFLSVRITYATMQGWTFSTPYSTTSGIESSNWYTTLAPLVVLAVPLYDFTSVVLLRLSQGKSPLVGDLQHVSHRFVQRGLSRPMAVAVICGFAGVMGLAGIVLMRTDGPGALMIGAMVLLLLGVIAMMEFARSGQALPSDSNRGPMNEGGA